MEEVIQGIQRDLGQFKILVQRHKLDDGKRVLKGLYEQVARLDAFVLDPSEQRKLKEKIGAGVEEYDTGARWSLETTHHPERC